MSHAAGTDISLIAQELGTMLLCDRMACEAADDADVAHDHDGEQESTESESSLSLRY